MPCRTADSEQCSSRMMRLPCTLISCQVRAGRGGTQSPPIDDIPPAPKPIDVGQCLRGARAGPTLVPDQESPRLLRQNDIGNLRYEAAHAKTGEIMRFTRFAAA